MTLFGVMLVSMISAQITYYLIHTHHWPTVRASAFPTLIFVICLKLTGINWEGALQAAFFGATFVGMTDKSRLGWRRVLIASIIFGMIFTFLIPFARGIGGGLGAAAFASCSVIYLLTNLAKKFVKI
ncbi:hypothetical protein B9G69_002290 [Bdellovibrio sp. SKB1291214]|uniref:hypothetical protein n=1 Tax=Bdellovibrio sp. SKB1291214 TaxID=1732569 RepID=UPI000B51CDAE|nr:hypothetical protein [Bdellovibrio sp. SKB1291214]UYL09401.1 hypothetical protein B9G69_002290 [Bdellovibrio sp. SKB1291214]